MGTSKNLVGKPVIRLIRKLRKNKTYQNAKNLVREQKYTAMSQN